MNWTAWGVEVGEGEGREVHVLVSGEASGEEARAPAWSGFDGRISQCERKFLSDRSRAR